MVLPVMPSGSSMSEIAIMKGMSIFTASRSTRIGATSAVRPNITKMFMILLPTMLPMVMSAFPEMAALMLTAASGALVPIATTVSPITICGTPNLWAIVEAPLTKKSAPLISSTNPATRIPRLINIICIMSTP